MKDRKRRSSNFANLTLVGMEPFLLEEEILRMKKDFEGDTAMNVSVFSVEDKDGVDIEAIISLCNTVPFLAHARIVIVRNAHKLGASHLERIESYLRDPCETTSFVLCLEPEKTDKGIEQLIRRLGAFTEIRRFEPIRDKNERVRWIMDRARLRGKTMDRPAASLLADTCGSSLGVLDGEVDKICLWVGDRTEVGISDVTSVVTKSVETTIFTFMDALFDRKKDAIVRMDELAQAGMSDLELISRIENMIIIHYGLFRGHDIKRLKVHSYTEQKALRRKSLWTAQELLSFLREVRSIEHGLKSGMIVSGFEALAGLVGRIVLAERGVRPDPRGA